MRAENVARPPLYGVPISHTNANRRGLKDNTSLLSLPSPKQQIEPGHPPSSVIPFSFKNKQKTSKCPFKVLTSITF
jgi:hypothetical protein